MEVSARQIADIIQATIEGDADVKVSSLSKIEEGKPGTISFLGNLKYTPYLYTTEASIVIVNNDFTTEKAVKPTLLRVPSAQVAFSKLLEFYNQIKNNKQGISSLAFISPAATIGNNVYIGEFAVIGDHVKIADNVKIFPQTYVGDNSQIGEGTVLFAGVKLYSETVVGKRCILHSGVVVGSDGFGFIPDKDNVYHKIPQTGNVVIEDDVEIGSNTTVDRSTLGSTLIRSGVKLDNLCQIAHNVVVGENTVMASQSGIAGSSKVGRNVMIGGQVGISGHFTIADNVKIAGQSGVDGNVKEEGAIIMGSPAFDIRRYQRASIHFRNLSDIVNRINELEKKVRDLEGGGGL